MTPDLYQQVESAVKIAFAAGAFFAFCVQLPFLFAAWYEERFGNDR